MPSYCSGCQQPINEELGIVIMHLKTPESHALFHFCSGVCVTPWLENINKSYFDTIMKKFMDNHE